MNDQGAFYSLSIDGRTGNICFPALGYTITNLVSRVELSRKLIDYIEDECESENGFIYITLREGRLFEMPCMSRLMFLGQELKMFMFAVPLDCLHVRAKLAQRVGGTFANRDQLFDWGVVFTDTQDGFTSIVHRFAAEPIIEN